ncbi:cellulase family glycosylhydrolase [Candidatus Chloroploca sp. M-50]|uniref:Cellulase family glycosylhydrolase n=1 Tax=Candidatus Chloroploca mongolica TaxID=2528176 RepID=A0ABS4DFZ6_9CHLR|nr:cellulase family glycosylhydrolase [Candidatus Chloroploca mongolica]MBP1468345.1 cellulase family glycosylhydrolase [Candidatus Chloroploca mongolica]
MPRTIRLRSSGDDVRFLQERLNARPPSALPPLDVDGKFGAKTQARVQEFQANNGLSTNGVVESLTWGSLLGHAVAQTRGFFVLGRDLYDRRGARVILRGVNKMSVWDNDDPVGLVSFPQIKQTGANTVRIVWAITTNLQPGGPATATATLDALIKNAKANRLIPMIELHDGTGTWGRLDDLVSYWTQPEVVKIIKQHQTYLLVNIGNEVGDAKVSQADFIAGYSDSIQRMRAAGIRTPLVIDASDWGKNLEMLNSTAATLRAADPEGNLIFSVHLYWSLACGADASFIRSNLQQAVNLGYPLIVGEFSQYGGYPCGNPNASICGPAGEIDYRTILAACHEHELGWYAWEWGPGNGFNDPLCAIMDMTHDRLFANLKPGWAHEVAISSPFGIQQTSVTPASI